MFETYRVYLRLAWGRICFRQVSINQNLYEFGLSKSFKLYHFSQIQSRPDSIKNSSLYKGYSPADFLLPHFWLKKFAFFQKIKCLEINNFSA